MTTDKNSIKHKIITYSHVINAFATVVLVIITTIYVCVTYKMALTSEAERKPYLCFDGIKTETVVANDDKNNDVLFSLKFSNAGKSVLKYKVESIKLSDNISIKDFRVKAEGNYIFPEKSTEYLYCVIDGQKLTTYPVNGTLEYVISYWSTENEKKVYKSTQKMNVYILKDYTRYLTTYEKEE